MVNGVEVIMDNNSSTSIVKLPDPAVVTPLSAIADAFEDLAKLLNHGDLPLDAFYEACSFVSVLFNCLGFAFKFAELEYVSKLEGLMEASPACSTLKDVIEVDVANKTVKSPGSYSRNLRRVRQGIDLIRAIFEQLLATDDSCLKDIASTAYGQICAPYHTWAVRTAVHAGMYTLPTREQLFIRLNETEQSAGKKMKRYMDNAMPVIEYVDNLYLSRMIPLDW
ncbi:hypothetical protein PIB30_052286 [Stylosanthes scabra]|uniref:Glycolipid transfer protein domain-containing protein n=1 Tax=Stylosanthes scabra TaxID=79078 RepID=A0ABU6ZGZ3_9FABA|nr:hypothetical protein [Stylosanthes scabra]